MKLPPILERMGLYKLLYKDARGDRQSKFIILCIRSLSIIFIFYAILYVFIPRRYTVRYLYILPGEKNTSSISLPEIGNADISYGSAGYARSTFDPRENYRSIFLSKPVIENAKKILNVDYFPQPRIDLTPNSTLISVKVTSPSIEQSIRYANALNQSAISHISELRKSSISERRRPVDSIVQELSQRLNQAQENLAKFQETSKLQFEEQSKDLLEILTNLKSREIEISNEIKKYEGEIESLENMTSLNKNELKFAFLMRDDVIISEFMSQYSILIGKINANKHIFGKNHPIQKNLLNQSSALAESIIKRSEELLGVKLSIDTINNVFKANSTENVSTDIIVSLILKKSTLAGQKGVYNEILKQRQEYGNELNELIKLRPKLADLERDVALSEAVISSALANLEYSESNFYEGYPQIQIIEEPRLEMYRNYVIRTRFILAFLLTLFLAFIGISLHLFGGVMYIEKVKKLISNENG